MASFSIDGMVSGLDTTAIINQLMKIESQPQTLLIRKQNTAKDTITALQGINTKARSLADAAKAAANPSSWAAYTAKSSASSIATAKASENARAGSLTFAVDAVATKQVSLTQTVTSGDDLGAGDPPTFTIKQADGTLTTVTAESSSLKDIATAITGADAGVTATVVQVTGGSTPSYRLQFTANDTGSDGTFEIFTGDEDAVGAGTAARLDTGLAHAATDASITLWKGSEFEQTYTQSSNTFSNLMDGVDVTIAEVTAPGASVTITVEPDSAKVKGMASGLVGALGVVLSDIASHTAPKTTTNDNGTTSVTAGLLGGDPAMRMIRDQLVEAMTYPVNGVSPATIGIVIERDGTVTFDEAKFDAAFLKDPEGTAEFMQTLASRVFDVADAHSDKYTGTLTQKITSQERMVDDFGKQIADWDVRLELRRSSLQATYTALEVSLASLNAQSSWLSGQLAALNSNNNY